MILLAAPGNPWESWWKVPALIAAISATSALANLIPIRVAGVYSDGALLIQLVRGGPFADFRETMTTVGTTTVTATRPRDLDAQVFAYPTGAEMEPCQNATLRVIEMICAIDRQELALGKHHLEAA